MAASAVVGASTASVAPAGGAGAVAPAAAGASASGARTARRKQRCWLFQVDGVTGNASEVELLASIRERYTTVKRLAVRPAASSKDAVAATDGSPRNVVVEVQFTGPQPSEGPGALLCDLLCGVSVDAKPVELPRGRKKRARTATTASIEGSDSDIEDGGSRKMGGHRSTNSLGRLDDEDEEDSAGGGRCVSNKPSSQGGSPTVRGSSKHQVPPATFRRTSSRDSDGQVVPSSGLGPLSTVGIFENPSSSSNSASNVPTRAVVPADDGSCRGAPGALPAANPQQHRVVSNDAMQPPSSQKQHSSQPLPQPFQQALHHQQHHFGRPAIAVGVAGGAGTGGTQWDDVVQRMTTPQGSCHSLEMGSEHSSNGSNGQPPVKAEYDSLVITSNNSVGTWNSNDSQVALLGPMPPPQSVQPPLGGWSFDSAQVADSAAGGSAVVDLSDVNGLFRGSAADGEAVAAVAAAANAGGSVTDSNGSMPGSTNSNADAGAGRQQQHEVMSDAKWANDGHLPMEKVVIEPSRNECDFEGRPTPPTDPTSGQPPIPSSTDRQCHLVFTGLNNTGQDLRSLRVTAHFGVDSVHKVGKVTSPIQLGSNGRAYAGVFYPSMQEIWPELYSTSNIRVVEVDLVVEIRSDSGEYQYVGPQLKVTYLRAAPPADAAEATPRPAGRRTASRAPIPFNSDGHQVSYSCVDYSCGDWFSDMCQSVFRSGATAHQPLHDDPNDLMNVDP
ncbi:unnamed protein product [Ectocarpus sp. CCAP 1310/34]|nr:unnamed protein product [Ectocarpus sp. CCAP 1310/34]